MTKHTAEKLRELRQKNGYSQEELAAKLFVTRQAISKWERGEALPDTENLIALAELYGVSIDEIVGRTREDEKLNTGTQNEGKENAKLDTGVQNDAWEQKEPAGEEAESDMENEPQDKESAFVKAMHALPYPIVTTALFLLLGFLWNLWDVAWILFVSIPLYYSIIDCISKKRLSLLNYPVLATCVYLFLGMRFSLWHPGWVIYFTVPIFYSAAHALDNKK